MKTLNRLPLFIGIILLLQGLSVRSLMAQDITFTLIDASTNQPVPGFDPMTPGQQLHLGSLPSQLSIRANVPSQFESVRFRIINEGIIFHNRVENVPPYTLAGDINGDYTPFDNFSVFNGERKLFATAFTQNRARGMAGATGRIVITIVDKPIGFTLIRATTNSDLQELNDGDIIFEDFLFSINVRVDFTAGADVAVESVRFDLDGQIGFRVENFPPYALFGDINGDYFSGTFTPGTHTLSITAFTQNRARGEVVVTSTIEFEVLPGKPEANDDIPHYNYPNPFTDATNLVFELPEAGDVQLTVYDLLGQEVTTLTDGWREAGQHVITFYTGNAPEGIYFYKLRILNGTLSGRMLLTK